MSAAPERRGRVAARFGADEPHAPAGDFWMARLRSLQEIAHAVNSDQHLDTVLQTIVDTVVTHSLWRECCVARLDPEREEVVFVAERGFRTLELGGLTRWSVAESITPLAWRANAPLAIEDILSEPVSRPLHADARERGYRSVLIVPLRGVDPPAAVWFCGAQPHRFSTEEIAYASAIADQAAIAIKHAELHQRERAQIAELERLNVVNAQQRAVLERQAQVHARLTQLVLADQGLDAILESAARVLENPVRVFDRWRRPLAAHDAAADWLSPALLDRAARERRPFMAEEAADAGGAAIAVPITVGRELLGVLVVQPRWRAFHDGDLVVAEQVAVVVALELMKLRIAYEVELRIQSDFLGGLLAGQPSDSRDLHARAALLGVDLAQPTWLLVFAFDATAPDGDEIGALGRRRELLDAVRHMLSGRVANAVVVLQGDQVVAVLPQHDGAAGAIDALAADTRAEVEALVGASVSVGHGQACRAAADYPLAYRQARKALDVQRVLGKTGQACSFHDLGVYGLLFSEENAAELARFAGEVLSSLDAYDEQHRAPLRQTLDMFLRQNGNLRRTAAALFIHISTLRYRLERIEALTGLRLDDAEHRFRFQLALRIAQLTRTG